MMAVVDYNLGHPEIDELSDNGDGQYLCSVAADLIHEMRRELYETQDQIFELEAQLAEEKAARERAEATTEQSIKTLNAWIDRAEAAERRIEQLEVQLAEADERDLEAAKRRQESKRLKEVRAYFENGCACIHLTKILQPCPANMPDNEAVAFYEQHCKCTRNYVQS